MKRAHRFIAAAMLAAAATPALAASTINPSTPAQNAALNSAPVRSNFQAAYNDINNLLSMYYGPSAPQSPSNLQSWANSSGYPVIVLNYYNSARAAWIPYAQINVTANTYQSLVGAGVAATPPIGVTYPSGIATFALNYGPSFSLNGNTLVLNPAASAVLGGVLSSSAPAHQYATGVDTGGNVIYTHPSNADISGLGALATAGAGTGLAIDGSGNLDLQPAQPSAIGGVESDTNAAHQWIAYIDGSGIPHQAQPQLSDIGGLINAVTNADLAQSGAATFKGNPTAASANAQDFTVQGLTDDASPDMVNDVIPIYNHTSGTLQKASPSQLFGSVGNVTSVTNLDGTLNVAPTVGNVVASLNPGILYNYLGGLILSNDSASPTNTLDIEAGVATDSTNAQIIKIGAFTKTTAGPWVAGSGNAGMGNGLTAAASTWYDVCLAYNGGTPDIWFDTSNRATTYSQCANKPSGISGTLFRRIGSIKTNSSSQIATFVQRGDQFIYQATPADDYSGAPTLSTTDTSFALNVPSGVLVTALYRLQMVASTIHFSAVKSPFEPAGYVSAQANMIPQDAGATMEQEYQTPTSTAAINIAASTSYALTSLTLNTYAYIDTRGKTN